MNVDFAGARWSKSSKSGDIDCVEVAFAGRQVGVRDSKCIEQGHLMFTAEVWGVFIAGVMGGDFEQS
ncbi:DUF397 domain-containing protein [Nocardia sp. NPDC057227]|uniref:DUF397 domain-containing protein n=1 Tax=Nocardia sp. NPDC057227 TaxID=3346056 RepID=UPI00362FFAD3